MPRPLDGNQGGSRAQTGHFCGSCGTELGDSSGRFCPNCGAQLVSHGAARVEEPTRQSSPRSWLWVLAAAVLVAALGAAAALLLLTGGGGTKEQRATLPAPTDLPPNVVALIADVPSAAGTITRHDFAHALELATAEGNLRTVPRPGESKYEELKETALNALFDSAWIEGQADEMGISVTPNEVAGELRKLKRDNFKTEAAYEKFLRESHDTAADVNERVTLQILSTKIQAQITESVPKPSEGEVAAYYRKVRKTQFTQKPTRDVRIILNRDRTMAEEAKALLEQDDSATSWKRIAKRYSQDQLTKGSGGLRSGVVEGTIEEPLSAAIFQAFEHQLEGPVKSSQGYNVFEIVRSTPESVETLSAVRRQVESQLGQQVQQTALSNFVNSYTKRWRARTVCAPGFVVERCSNGRQKPAATSGTTAPVTP